MAVGAIQFFAFDMFVMHGLECIFLRFLLEFRYLFPLMALRTNLHQSAFESMPQITWQIHAAGILVAVITAKDPMLIDAVIDQLVRIGGDPGIGFITVIAHTFQAVSNRGNDIAGFLEILIGVHGNEPTVRNGHGLNRGLILERIQLAVRHVTEGA